MTGYINNIITLEDGWNRIKVEVLDRLENMLENGCDADSRLFSDLEYREFYTLCYNMCTQKPPYNWSEQLYQRQGETIAYYLTRIVLPVLKDKHGEHLLIEFVRRSKNQEIMIKWYQKLFMYLDRYHVKYYQLPSIKDAGLRCYKTIIFDAIKTEVTTAIIEIINNERSGAVIDKDLIKSSIRVYEKMGMGRLNAYISDFETKFLESTREYYAQRVERSLEEEKARVGEYLNTESEPKLLQAVEEALSARQQ